MLFNFAHVNRTRMFDGDHVGIPLQHMCRPVSPADAQLCIASENKGASSSPRFPSLAFTIVYGFRLELYPPVGACSSAPSFVEACMAHSKSRRHYMKINGAERRHRSSNGASLPRKQEDAQTRNIEMQDRSRVRKVSNDIHHSRDFSSQVFRVLRI